VIRQKNASNGDCALAIRSPVAVGHFWGRSEVDEALLVVARGGNALLVVTEVGEALLVAAGYGKARQTRQISIGIRRRRRPRAAAAAAAAAVVALAVA
jgi:hypothetical protein